MQSEQAGQVTLGVAEELILANDVIFCTTRYHYMPYDDYFTLARLSGYPVIYIDQIPQSGVKDKVFICAPLNGEWQHGIKSDGYVIWNQLEWHTDYSRMELPHGVAEGWSGDRWHADLIGARFTPLGSHVDLNLHPDKPRTHEYDIAFMAYTDIYRRKCVKDALEAQGFSSAPNGWGTQRDEILRKSRVMLHVHQHENIPTIAPLRWCIAAAYHLPIISETVSNRAPFLPQHFISWNYEALVEKTTQHLHMQHYSELNEYGENLHHFLCHEFTFRNSIERAL